MYSFPSTDLSIFPAHNFFDTVQTCRNSEQIYQIFIRSIGLEAKGIVISSSVKPLVKITKHFQSHAASCCIIRLTFACLPWLADKPLLHLPAAWLWQQHTQRPSPSLRGKLVTFGFSFFMEELSTIIPSSSWGKFCQNSSGALEQQRSRLKT